MATKHTEEEINELLEWAKERLDKKDYPKEPVRLSAAHLIPNCGTYIDAMLCTLSKHQQNTTFIPMIDDFCKFRDKLEQIRNEATENA